MATDVATPLGKRGMHHVTGEKKPSDRVQSTCLPDAEQSCLLVLRTFVLLCVTTMAV